MRDRTIGQSSLGHTDTLTLLAVTAGASTYGEIIASTGLARSTIAGILNRLRALGFVSWDEGKRGTIRSLLSPTCGTDRLKDAFALVPTRPKRVPPIRLSAEETLAANTVAVDGGCIEWMGSRLPTGYGRISVNGERVYAHRWAYEHWVGPIPEGLTIDHLCKNPPCVNPSHLEPVTLRENVLRSNNPAAINARKTHCVNGHEFTPENTRLNGTHRVCLACKGATA